MIFHKLAGWFIISTVLFTLSLVDPVHVPNTYGPIARELFHIPSKWQSQSEISCMAKTIYLEAGNQTATGQYAVAWVIMNRAIKTNSSFCQVVMKKDAFTCYWDGRARKFKLVKQWEKDEWAIAFFIAKDLIMHYNNQIDITSGATCYHTLAVHPKWRKNMIVTLRLGNHIFYKEKT